MDWTWMGFIRRWYDGCGRTIRRSVYYEPSKRYSVQDGFTNRLEQFAVDDRYNE
jgi:hypothetical protein